MRRAARSAAAAAVDLRAGWREARYCAIDVETTGLDLRRDSIISIGSVGIHDGRVVCSDNYYSLIRPACPVSGASMRIHCLRPADLENAPGARDVGQEIARQLAGRIVVAHAAWIERAFLSRLLRQVGVRFAAPVIDTAALARAGLRPGQPARPRAIPRTASTATLIAGLRTAPRARRRGHRLRRCSSPWPPKQGSLAGKPTQSRYPRGPWLPYPPRTLTEIRGAHHGRGSRPAASREAVSRGASSGILLMSIRTSPWW